MDNVDKVLAQWRKEKPGLEVDPMGLIGRIKRLALILNREMAKTWAEHGMNTASFDVLATLRRSGPPFALSPGDLIDSAMVTSGTMTNRIDQLEKSGLVERKQSAEDKRSFLIQLTDKGFAAIEVAVDAHVETQKKLVSGLQKNDRESLDHLLRSFLVSLED